MQFEEFDEKLNKGELKPGSPEYAKAAEDIKEQFTDREAALMPVSEIEKLIMSFKWDSFTDIIEIITLVARKDKSGNTIKPIQEWLRSEYYIGSMRSKDTGGNLSRFWEKKIIEIFDGGGINYFQAIITGSTASGKSYFARVVWLRILYMFSCLDNRALKRALGLDVTSTVVFALITVSMNEAKLAGFDDFREAVDSIEYFRKWFPRNPRSNRVLLFDNGIRVLYGSDSLHVLGTNLFSSIFDEANFMRNGAGNPGNLDKAMSIYEQCHMRVSGRFAKKSTVYQGFNLLISSCTHKNSFTENLIKQCRTITGSMLITARRFEIYPEAWGPERFLMFLGSDDKRPKAIKDLEDFKTVALPKTVEKLAGVFTPQAALDCLSYAERDNYLLGPMEFLRDAEMMPEATVRDVFGHSIAALDSFFRNEKDYDIVVKMARDAGIVHRFSQETIVLSLKNNTQIGDYFDFKAFVDAVGNNPLYMHVDQSTTHDPTGIAAACLMNRPEWGGPKIVVVLKLRINPPGGSDKIDIEKCRLFIEHLRQKGCTIARVTYDGFQSSASLQLLTKAGIDNGNQSLDRIDTPWITFSDYVTAHRVVFYDYPPFKEELFGLIHDRERMKVDHPKTNAKDVSDAVVGAFYNCYNAQDSLLRANFEVDRLGMMTAFIGGEEHTHPQGKAWWLMNRCLLAHDGTRLPEPGEPGHKDALRRFGKI